MMLGIKVTKDSRPGTASCGHVRGVQDKQATVVSGLALYTNAPTKISDSVCGINGQDCIAGIVHAEKTTRTL